MLIYIYYTKQVFQHFIQTIKSNQSFIHNFLDIAKLYLPDIAKEARQETSTIDNSKQRFMIKFLNLKKIFYQVIFFLIN